LYTEPVAGTLKPEAYSLKLSLELLHFCGCRCEDATDDIAETRPAASAFVSVETRPAASRFVNTASDSDWMARKRKKKTFSAATVVREMARERVGSPKPSHPVPAKKSKPEKHKTTLGKLLNEE